MFFTMLLTIAFISVSSISFFSDVRKINMELSCCFLIFFISIIYAHRPIQHDTVGYLNYLDSIQELYSNDGFLNAIMVFEPAYGVYTYFFSLLDSHFFFLASIPFFMLVIVSNSTKGILKTSYRTLFLLSVSMYPYFIAYAASGLRQGIAMSIYLFCLVSIIKQRKKMFALSIIVGGMFHYSFFLFSLAFLALSVRLSIRYFLIFWIFCVVASILKISYFFVNVVDFIGFSQRYQVYFTQGEVDYATGFRIDFFLLSLVPIILYYILRPTSEISSASLKVYLLGNALSFLLCFMPYSDRFYSYSWFLIPFLIALFSQGKIMNAKFSYIFNSAFMMILFISLFTYSDKWIF